MFLDFRHLFFQSKTKFMDPELIVSKFGGTSMADIDCMRKCAEIVLDNPNRKVVIVSATAGTTDQLSKLCEKIDIDTKSYIIDQIRIRHLSLLRILGTSEQTCPSVEELSVELLEFAIGRSEISPSDRDYILSFGERLSSTIFAAVLRQMNEEVVWLDVREVLLTDNFFGKAEPQLEQIALRAKAKLLPLLEKGRVISQGFVGATIDGKTTTLGRGGSDYSAALFAEALSAKTLEIWTDVPGIFSADPRIVEDAFPIREISFSEAAELAIYGAKVLHPATLKAAIRKRTNVFIGKSMDPGMGGTWITGDPDTIPSIRGITFRKNQRLLTLHSVDMLHQFGFLARVFEILARYKISVDLVTTSEVNVSLTLDTGIQSGFNYEHLENAIAEVKEFCRVSMESDLALIALIGNRLNQTAGISGKIFQALSDVNIRLICYGASSHNICFLVDDRDAVTTVQLLHRQFLGVKVI